MAVSHIWNKRISRSSVGSLDQVFFPRQTFRLTTMVFLAISVVLIAAALLVPKGDLVLWFNGRYAPGPNLFFKYITHLGDGLVFVPFVLALLWVRIGYAITAAVTGVVLALLSNFFKHVVFIDFPRPKAWFADPTVLQFVEGVKVHSMHAFPSGHTATAAALAVLASLFFRHRHMPIIAAALALLVGMSRVYLAQHFLVDVAFGYFYGSVTAIAAYHLGYLLYRSRQRRSLISGVSLSQNN